MRKLFALAGQVRAKGGRGAPYAGPVCLVFVSRASNSMLSNLAGASAYCPPRTSFSAAACSRPARDRLTHQWASMLLRVLGAGLSLLRPQGARLSVAGRPGVLSERTNIFYKGHMNESVSLECRSNRIHPPCLRLATHNARGPLTFGGEFEDGTSDGVRKESRRARFKRAQGRSDT